MVSQLSEALSQSSLKPKCLVEKKVLTRLVLVQLLFGCQCGAKGLLVCAFAALFTWGTSRQFLWIYFLLVNRILFVFFAVLEHYLHFLQAFHLGLAHPSMAGDVFCAC